MNIRYATFFFAAACGCGASAQLTLNDPDNVPLIGDTFTYHTGAYAAPPAGGSGINFDYSGLTETGTTTWTWIAPDDYSNVAAFPNAEMAAASAADTIFYEVTANGLERVGERQVILSIYDVEVPFTDASLNLQLPLTYGATWNDNIAATFMAGTYPSTRTGTINGIADASGSLQLPGGGPAIDVLRVRTITQEVNVIETDLFDVTVTHKRTEHAYYAQYLKTPILRVYTDSLTSSIGVNQNYNSTEWLDESLVGIFENQGPSLGLGLFPNPAADQVWLTLAGAVDGPVTITVADAAGRALLSERKPSGTNQHALDTRSLAAGCYSVTVTDANGKRGSAHFLKQ